LEKTITINFQTKPSIDANEKHTLIGGGKNRGLPIFTLKFMGIYRERLSSRRSF
jgi:hypothetical protein